MSIPVHPQRRSRPLAGTAAAAVLSLSVVLSGGASTPASAAPVDARVSTSGYTHSGSVATEAARVAVKRTVQIGSADYVYKGRNVARSATAVVVYTAPRRQAPASRTAVDVVVKGGLVSRVVTHGEGRRKRAVRVPAGGAVFSATGAAGTWLRQVSRPGLSARVVSTTVPTADGRSAVPSAGQSVTLGSTSYTLTGVNTERGVNALVAYTAPLTRTPTTMWGVEVTVVDGRVVAVNNRVASRSSVGTTIPADGYVLSGHNLAADWLLANARVGGTVQLPGSTSPTPTPTPTPTPSPTPVPSGAGAQLTVGTEARIGASSFTVSAINSSRNVNALVAYRAPVTVTPTNEWGVEVTVIGGRVTAVNNRLATRSTTGTRVPSDGLVLSGHGTAADWLLARAAVGSSVTFGAPTAEPTPAPTPTPRPTPTPTPTPTVPSGSVVKVMPLGDSITQVGGYAMGYKGYVLDKLVASGERIDYVGSQRATGPSQLKDFDHEGHSGWQNSNFQPVVGGLISTYRPDVVTYHVGTNDIWSNIDANTAISRLRDVLTKIYAAKPDTHVVLATIVRQNVGKDAAWTSYNNQIPGVVAEFANKGRRISLADLRNAIGTGDLQADGIHLTEGGHQKMANAFYPAIKAAVDSVQ